jgi:predicted  nucleic acid-binding Zn-ribbon protein
MNKYLSQLVELVETDKKIDSFEPEIQKIRANLDAQLAKEAELVKKIEENRELLQSNELSKNKNELHLAELAEKIKELSNKSAAVKTDKEMKALQLEEEIAKEQIEFANEEIERLEKIKELKEIEMAEFQEEIDGMQEKTAEIQVETEKELAELEKTRMKVYEDKQKLLSQMNQNIIIFYEKIRRWAKNSTVVPVKKQACYGCYMKLNDHVYANVIRGEEITTCPHCGRILYLDQTEEEVAEESAS